MALSTIDDIFPDEENLTQEMSDIFNCHGIPGLNKYVDTSLDKWKSVKIKFAFTGSSGAGKSSLINALRGIDQSHVNAAEEGVTETTQEICSYTYPNNEQIELFDLPGCGTRKHPIQSYLSDMAFQRYDFVIMVTSQRFSENDALVIKELQRLKKAFFLVRSKVGFDVENQRWMQGRDVVLNKIRNDCLKNLQIQGVEGKEVYLVDSHVHHDFDLGKLQISLVRDAPNELKTSLILTFRNSTKEVIQKKIKCLKSRVKYVALKALASAVPGAKYLMDENVLMNEISFYEEVLGLDSETLEKICNYLNVDKPQLQEMLKLSGVTFLAKGVIVSQFFDKTKLDTKVICLTALLLAIDSAVEGSLSCYKKVYSALSRILDTLEKDALKIVEAVLEKERGTSFM